MRGTICKTLTQTELRDLSFEEAVKLHRERKPYGISQDLHGNPRRNRRVHVKRHLKRHIKENQLELTL